jgi:hypothetical protein
MQSKMWYSWALPKFLARANQYSSCGCSSAGQARVQAPQRMQGSSGPGGGNSAGLAARMQLAALVTGRSVRGRAKPIIGPPMMKRSVSAFGAASASRSSIGVPISTSWLPGRATLPVRVTMREMSGSPCSMARWAA